MGTPGAPGLEEEQGVGGRHGLQSQEMVRMAPAEGLTQESLPGAEGAPALSQ